MDINLQARVNLSGKSIDLNWTWRTSQQESERFRLLRRERKYPENPSDGVCVLNMIVPVDSDTVPGSTEVLVVMDDPNSGDRAFSFTVVDKGLVEEIQYYYTLFAGEGSYTKPVTRAAAMASGQQQPNFSEQLYRLLPEVYRAYDEPSPVAKERGSLKKFLEIFGGALDYFRSRAEGLRGLHDVLQTRSDLLPHLAQWIGWDLDLAQDEISQRMEILFAPELYQTVGTLPNIQALVNRVTGWNCRIKEFVHNVCLSNAPEIIHKWDIWEATRNSADNAWLKPVQCTIAENFDARPSCVKDAGNHTWLFWQASRNDESGIYYQNIDVSGVAPRRINLYPQDEPDRPLQNAESPSVILTGENLWLFCEAGQMGKREIWWTTTLASDSPAQNLSLHPADNANPTAVTLGDQVWVFWQSNRRGPTDIWARVHQDGQWGPPKRITTADLHHRAPAAVVEKNNTLWLFYSEEYFSKQGFSSRLRCLTYDGQTWTEREDACTEGPNDESPAAVVCKSKIWLFWHAQDEKGHWEIWSKTFNSKKWGQNVQITNHPASDKEPTSLVDANGRLRVFWRSQRRSYFRVNELRQKGGYPLQSCTVDTHNTDMLNHVYLNKASFENHVHYTYDTRVSDANQTGINNEAWCARDTVGVYLTPDTLDAELITQGQELVKGLIHRFLPLQTRILFIIEPPVILEKVYTYDFPDDEPQTYIGEQYVDILERVEQYDGPTEGYIDTLPDWIWLRAWGKSCRDHRTVDTKTDSIVTRYRTWQIGLKSGG